MNNLYLFCMGFGALMSLAQIIMGSFDMSHDGHFDGHGGGGHDKTHGNHSAQQSLNLWTIRSISGGITFFGAGGGITQSLSGNLYVGLSMAVLCGWVGLYVTAWVISRLTKFDADGTMHVENAVGSVGRAYITMAPGAVGMALVNVQGRTMKMSVRNGSSKMLESGDPLKVLEMQGEVAIVVPPTATTLHG